MQIKVDLTNADTPEPIPAGVYEAVVSGIELRDSKSSEWQYLNVEFTILSGEYANRKLWTALSLSPKAAWKLKKALVAFGLTKEQLQGQVVFDPNDFIGSTCLVEVIQAPNPRTNEMRNEVRGIYPPKSPTPFTAPKPRDKNGSGKTIPRIK